MFRGGVIRADTHPGLRVIIKTVGALDTGRLRTWRAGRVAAPLAEPER